MICLTLRLDNVTIKSAFIHVYLKELNGTGKYSKNCNQKTFLLIFNIEVLIIIIHVTFFINFLTNNHESSVVLIYFKHHSRVTEDAYEVVWGGCPINVHGHKCKAGVPNSPLFIITVAQKSICYGFVLFY